MELTRSSASYDDLCSRAYGIARAWLVPENRNSQYAYALALRRALVCTGRWLDIGCGHDFLPSWMAESDRILQLERWATVGIDLDASAIKRHTGLSARVLGNAERLPFADGAFHLLTANMVVEHVQEPEALFHELARVLAAGGTLIVHTPNVTGYTTALTRLIPCRLLRWAAKLLHAREPEDVYPTFYRLNSAAALRKTADLAGMNVQRIQYVDSSPQLIRFPPAMLIELLWIRLLQRPLLEKFRACIVAEFRKSS